MKRVFSFDLDALMATLTLLVYSGVFLVFAATGRLALFLHPHFRPGVAVAGVIMAILAIAWFWLHRPWRPSHEAHDHDHDHDHHHIHGHSKCCGHTHEHLHDAEHCAHAHGIYRSAWTKLVAYAVLLGPFIAACWVSPEGFSRAVIQQRGFIEDASALGLSRKGQTALQRALEEHRENPAPTPVAAQPTPPAASTPTPPAPETPADPGLDLTEFLPVTDAGNVEVEVLDLLYAAMDPPMRDALQQRPLEMIGQVMPMPDTPGKFRLYRLFMACCAADARPISVRVLAPDPQETTDLPGWVRVTGRVEYLPEASYAANQWLEDSRIIQDGTEHTDQANPSQPSPDDNVFILLRATHIERTEPPAEPMLF